MPKGPKGKTMSKYIVGGVTERGVVYPPGGASGLIDEMRRIADARGKSVAQVRSSPFFSWTKVAPRRGGEGRSAARVNQARKLGADLPPCLCQRGPRPTHTTFP